MHPLSGQVISTRLVRATTFTVRYSSSGARSNVSSTLLEISDPHAKIRRAERLTKEAKRAEAEAKGLSNQGTTGDFAPGSSKPNTIRPRKFSKRDRVQPRSSGPARGTERSRQKASQAGAAEAIMAFSQRGPSEHRKQSIVPAFSEDDTVLDKPELPGVAAPEPIFTDIGTLLNNVPNLTSSLPRHLPPGKLQETPAVWLKQVYGDYSQWQLDSESYLKGARGLRSTYAEIILNRNPTVSSKFQKVLISAIKRATKEI